jgi:hypothetical protein
MWRVKVQIPKETLDEIKYEVSIDWPWPLLRGQRWEIKNWGVGRNSSGRVSS